MSAISPAFTLAILAMIVAHGHQQAEVRRLGKQPWRKRKKTRAKHKKSRKK